MNEQGNLNLDRRGFVSLVGSLGVGAFAASALSACGSDSTATGGAKTRKYTTVLDVAPYGKHAPWYVALEKGYWKKRGLNIQIQSAQGSGDAVTKLAAGAGEFVFADTSALILAVGNKNLKAKLVSMYHYKNLMSAEYLESSGIKEPKDLMGTTQYVIPGEGSFLLLPALAQKNGFDASKVKTVTGTFPGTVPAVAGGKADGTLTYATVFPALEAAAKKSGDKSGMFLYADYGIDVYNNGIMVTDKFLADHPEDVKAYCDGFAEAVVYSVKNPEKAAEIFVKHVPGLDAGLAQAQLEVAIDHLMVPEVEEHGFGPMDPDKMTITLDLVNQYFDLKTPVTDINSIFSNAYVTKGQVPKR